MILKKKKVVSCYFLIFLYKTLKNETSFYIGVYSPYVLIFKFPFKVYSVSIFPNIV